MTVDETREKRFAAAVIDLGPGIGLKDGVGRADGHDSVTFDR